MYYCMVFYLHLGGVSHCIGRLRSLPTVNANGSKAIHCSIGLLQSDSWQGNVSMSTTGWKYTSRRGWWTDEVSLEKILWWKKLICLVYRWLQSKDSSTFLEVNHPWLEIVHGKSSYLPYLGGRLVFFFFVFEQNDQQQSTSRQQEMK